MTPLIVSNTERQRVREIREYAEQPSAHRTAETPVVVGDDKRHSMIFPMGFRAVYSIDSGGQTVARHLSVSVVGPEQGRTVPSRTTMYLIAHEFGFGEEAVFGTLPSDPDYVVHAVEVFKPVEVTPEPEAAE